MGQGKKDLELETKPTCLGDPNSVMDSASCAEKSSTGNRKQFR